MRTELNFCNHLSKFCQSNMISNSPFPTLIIRGNLYNLKTLFEEKRRLNVFNEIWPMTSSPVALAQYTLIFYLNNMVTCHKISGKSLLTCGSQNITDELLGINTQKLFFFNLFILLSATKIDTVIFSGFFNSRISTKIHHV